MRRGGSPRRAGSTASTGGCPAGPCPPELATRAKRQPGPRPRSTTVRVTRTSCGPDSSASRSDLEHRALRASRAHSPMCTPAGAFRPAAPPRQPGRRRSARPGPSSPGDEAGGPISIGCPRPRRTSASTSARQPVRRPRPARWTEARTGSASRRSCVRVRSARSRPASPPGRRRTAGDRLGQLDEPGAGNLRGVNRPSSTLRQRSPARCRTVGTRMVGNRGRRWRRSCGSGRRPPRGSRPCGGKAHQSRNAASPARQGAVVDEQVRARRNRLAEVVALRTRRPHG